MSLVYNPDGQVFYICKEEEADPEEKNCMVENLDNHVRSITIQEEDNRMVENLDNHVRSITRICIVDVIATAIIMWYRYPQGVITSLISVVGYQGATKLERGILNWYISFQMLRLVTGIIIMFTAKREEIYYIMVYIVFYMYIIVRCRILVRLLP